MMAGILNGDVQCVVVKDLSRLGRTYIEVGELLFNTFVAYRVRFISVNDRYDSMSEDAGRKKLLILFKNLVNHMYSLDLGKKIRSSHMLKQQRGEILGSRPPYGYVYTMSGGNKHLGIEPQSAKVVKKIFELRLEGLSIIKIVDYLNRNDILPPQNHYYEIGIITSERYSIRTVWQNSYVGTLLRNEIYTGTLVQRKYDNTGKTCKINPKEEWIYHPNAHTAIVDRATFEAVQKLMDEASEKFKKHGNHLDENILRGKVFCSVCGKSAIRGYHRNKKNKHQVKYFYYCRHCRLKSKYDPYVPIINNIPLERMESTLLSQLNAHINTCLGRETKLKQWISSATVKKEQKELELSLQKKNEQLDKAGDMLAASFSHHLDGLLDEREFEIAQSKFQKDKQEAHASIERIQHELAKYNMQNIQKNKCLSAFNKLGEIKKLDRPLIETLIDRIVIGPTDTDIEISYNFKDEFDQMTAFMNEQGVDTND